MRRNLGKFCFYFCLSYYQTLTVLASYDRFPNALSDKRSGRSPSSLSPMRKCWPSILVHGFTQVFSKSENSRGLQTERQASETFSLEAARGSLRKARPPQPVSLPVSRGGKHLTSGPRGARWRSHSRPLRAGPAWPRSPTARAGCGGEKAAPGRDRAPRPRPGLSSAIITEMPEESERLPLPRACSSPPLTRCAA